MNNQHYADNHIVQAPLHKRWICLPESFNAILILILLSFRDEAFVRLEIKKC